MNGWDDKCDGTLWLQTEVKKHRRGVLTSPSQVEHAVQIDNVSVCDVEVTFTSTPENAMLHYEDGKPWAQKFTLEGSSAPRGRRSESRRKHLAVAQLNGEDEASHTLLVKATAQSYDVKRATTDGPLEESSVAILRLVLRRHG